MKTKFWKHQFGILFFWPFMSIIALAIVLAGLILTLKNTAYLGLLVGGLIPLVIIIGELIFDRRVLSKVEFSEDGIKCYRLKKQITYIRWSEITDVKDISVARGHRYLRFVAENKKLDVDLTKKMYEAIIALCPYPNLKVLINDIPCFEYLHKSK